MVKGMGLLNLIEVEMKKAKVVGWKEFVLVHFNCPYCEITDYVMWSDYETLEEHLCGNCNEKIIIESVRK